MIRRPFVQNIVGVPLNGWIAHIDRKDGGKFPKVADAFGVGNWRTGLDFANDFDRAAARAARFAELRQRAVMKDRHLIADGGYALLRRDLL